MLAARPSAPPHPSPVTAPVWREHAAPHASLDRLVALLMRLCAALSLLITAGIVLVLLRAAVLAPTSAAVVGGLLLGTAQVSLLALAVALPLGGVAAVVLGELAPSARRRLVPPLRLLAAMPAVVWGALALLAFAPLLPMPSAHSLLGAGLVLGGMLVPGVILGGLAALDAVPDTLREAAVALGASPLETLGRVVLPAAWPGLRAVLPWTLSRAIGETILLGLAAAPLALPLPPPLGGLLAPTATLTTGLLLQAPGLGGAALLLFGLTAALNLLAARWGGRAATP